MSGGDNWQNDFAADHGITVEEMAAKAKRVSGVFAKACEELNVSDYEACMIAAFLVETILLSKPEFSMLAFKIGSNLIGSSAPNLTAEQLVMLGAMPMPTDDEGESVH